EVVQVEIANAEKRERRAGDTSAIPGEKPGAEAGAGFLLHTNHFLHPELIPGSLELNATSTSRARHAHLEQRLEDYAKQVGTSGGPESTADLTDLLTTGPGEAPVSCTPDPGATYGDRSATLVTVQIDPKRKQLDLAPGSPADGMQGNRRYQL
ncbi:MAG: C45 family autoproteolytic acyltransferase/hydrolase, partial [Brevibacterium aurantiacum]